jgi:hypothetical protein
MTKQLSASDQLRLYRERHKRKFDDKDKLDKFVAKYKDLIELNLEKRSASRIYNFVKKHYLRPYINMSEQDGNTIAGKNRLRVKLTDNNYIKNNSSDEYMNLFESSGDPELDKVIIQSLKEAFGTKKQDSDYLVAIIDLSVYGPNHDMAIIVGDSKYYLSHTQIKKVKSEWSKVNPELERGKAFQTMLDFSKEICTVYHKYKH